MQQMSTDNQWSCSFRLRSIDHMLFFGYTLERLFFVSLLASWRVYLSWYLFSWCTTITETAWGPVLLFVMRLFFARTKRIEVARIIISLKYYFLSFGGSSLLILAIKISLNLYYVLRTFHDDLVAVKADNSVVHWVDHNLKYLGIFCVISCSSYSAISVSNCYLFGWKWCSMGLTDIQLAKFRFPNRNTILFLSGVTFCVHSDALYDGSDSIKAYAIISKIGFNSCSSTVCLSFWQFEFGSPGVVDQFQMSSGNKRSTGSEQKLAAHCEHKSKYIDGSLMQCQSSS